MNSHYEQHGGTYHREGDCLIPDLALPQETDGQPIGVWGQRHERWLKQERRALYNSLLLSGKLRDRLAVNFVQRAPCARTFSPTFTE